MAIRGQIEQSGTVARDQMRVTVESIGLELPAQAPLMSYTQQSSKTNYTETVSALTAHEANLIEQLTTGFKSSIRHHIECIQNHTRVRETNTELLYVRLKQINAYITDFHWAQAVEKSTSVLAKHELERIEKLMADWYALNQLGPEAVTAQDSLHEVAEALYPAVQAALEADLKLGSRTDAQAFCDRVGTFRAKLTTARYAEPETQWSPTDLINNVREFADYFGGAIPYRLQIETVDFDRMLGQIDQLGVDELRENMMMPVAEAVNDYLVACWQLERAHIQAVETALKLCQGIHHLKIMTA